MVTFSSRFIENFYIIYYIYIQTLEGDIIKALMQNNSINGLMLKYFTDSSMLVILIK